MDFTTTLLLLSAPPATGKTHWIDRFRRGLDVELLVVSPLRALADECRASWGPAVRVVTPEEYLLRPTSAEVVVFDEFHLYLYWGDTFRERMWEAFYGATEAARLCVLLTATVSPALVETVRTFAAHFDELLWVDRGNRRLRYQPARYLRAPSRRWILGDLHRQEKRTAVRLVFCRYRGEVRSLAAELSAAGFACLTCLGGEAGTFREKLAATPAPDYIISTTVLSHGVNLPEISRVYLLYPIENSDFWIQMVARGGRRGGAYTVVGLEAPPGIPYSPLRNYLALAAAAIRAWSRLREGLLPPRSV
jgi:superfamily II DNA or RNA helicase